MRVHRFLFAALVLAARVAYAESPRLDAQTFHPSVDPNASMVIEPPTTPGPLVGSVGAWLSEAYRPLSEVTSSGDVVSRPITSALLVHAVANVGLSERFGFGVSVPFSLFQTGDDGRAEQPKVPATAFGDVAYSLKAAILRNEGGGLGVGTLFGMSLPTGGANSFLGERGVTATPRVIVEYNLAVTLLQGSLGYTFRSAPQTWPEAGGVRFGAAVPWTLAFAVKPVLFGIDPNNRQTIELGLRGSLPAGPVGPFGSGDPGSARLSPVLLTLSDRVGLGHNRDAFVLAGIDIGLNDAVGVPTVRFALAMGWAHHDHDMDRDGVDDAVDECPEIAEDRDGFQDSDGCPEVDNDDDGVVDSEDACPNVKGEASTAPALNGCPGARAEGH